VSFSVVHVAVGVLLVVSLLPPWTPEGNGSTIAGHRFAVLLLERTPRTTATVAAGLALFGVSLAGGVLVAIGLSRAAAARTVRLALLGAVIAAQAVVLVRSGSITYVVGPGALLATAAAIVGLTAAALERCRPKEVHQP
jgi:hypothetical protein